MEGADTDREARLEEIRERWGKATDGPWQITRNIKFGPAVWTNHGGKRGSTRFRVEADLDQTFTDDDGRAQWDHDMSAVRAAPEDIDWLLSEIDRLKAKLEGEDEQD